MIKMVLGSVDMLSQKEADSLIEILKEIRDQGQVFTFPQPGEYKKIEVVSTDGKHVFIVDVNRKGSVNIYKKCTIQSRYQKDVPLLRLDINGPDHTNPDGETICGSHLHIYREGYGDKYAFPVPPSIPNTDDLIQALIDFLKYFKTTNVDSLAIEMVM